MPFIDTADFGYPFRLFIPDETAPSPCRHESFVSLANYFEFLQSGLDGMPPLPVQAAGRKLENAQPEWSEWLAAMASAGMYRKENAKLKQKNCRPMSRLSCGFP